MKYFFILVILIIAYIILEYNFIIFLQKKIKQARSSIDIYLTQRFDLIPNLTECVKGYMTFEKEVLSKITEMRIEYLKTKDLKFGAQLNNEFNKLIMDATQYPELKANENFLYLQKNLNKIEDQLQAARRIYNSEVTKYNTRINIIPSSIIAKIMGASEIGLWEMENN